MISYYFQEYNDYDTVVKKNEHVILIAISNQKLIEFVKER